MFKIKWFFLLQLLDENKLARSENLYLDFQTPERANKMYVYCIMYRSIFGMFLFCFKS